jgi:hypothetical protein
LTLFLYSEAHKKSNKATKKRAIAHKKKAIALFFSNKAFKNIEKAA